MNDFLVKLFGDHDTMPNVAARLGGTRTLVYLALLRLRDLRGHAAFKATASEISLLTGYSLKAVRRSLAGLEAVGVVRCEHVPGGPLLFRVADPGVGQIVQGSRFPHLARA